MDPTLAGWLQALALVAALALCHRPLGDHIARLLTGTRHLAVERGLYRLAGVDRDADQRWPSYLRSVLAFSLVCVLFLYLLERIQNHLVLSLGHPPLPAHQAWNTAVSYTTNTNWQSYGGEQAMGHTVQMVGLTVQNFVSAASGLAVAATLVRGFTRSRTDRVGNFWVDLTRVVLRLLLPAAVVFALVLAAAGVIQNLHGFHTVPATLGGGSQAIPGGPVASQEAIKELGTNGGGFFRANSAHPFENPNGFTNWLEAFLLLVIPFSLPRTFGRMVGDPRQGRAVLAAMALFWAAATSLLTWFEAHHGGTALRAAGAALEGKEIRLGVPASALFAAATTLSSTGAVDAAHDSLTPGGGGVALFDMMLGEIAPGGVGSGLYAILVLVVVAVFIAGLMVGRTPEYLGKKLGGREIKFASLFILTTPAIVLVGTGVAVALPGERAGMLNSGAHGFTEVLYAFTSAANNNGSAFAGLAADTVWYDTALGLAMVFGRFLPMIFVVALAGSLAGQQPVPASAGTLPTHRPLFIGLLCGVILIVVGLIFFPALALGPIAEGLH